MCNNEDLIENQTDTPHSILEMNYNEAKEFLLKPESYCNFKLPEYFVLNDYLKGIDNVLSTITASDYCTRTARDSENVNHLILDNKDGRQAWRPLQLIHPALYISLVRILTEKSNWEKIIERFTKFGNNPYIKCLSLPLESQTDTSDIATQIKHWWHEIEQKSIELAIDYEYIFHTDISNCYGSIYTHTISWAIHTKSVAKSNRRNNNYIGNIIDGLLQDMHNGQTNGIPQGSALMDFIAEMVLGFADLELAERVCKQGIHEYYILRYRDDYRIFVNNPQDGEIILKCLTEVLFNLGLRLNATKTKYSNMVIAESIKPDKYSWIRRKNLDGNPQKRLLIIYGHSIEFPNSGSVDRALTEFYKRYFLCGKLEPLYSLISIVTDIAYRNPKSYPICSAILGKFLTLLDRDEEKKKIVAQIKKRFKNLPNTGHWDIWLQRISLQINPEIEFSEKLCKLVQNRVVDIWDNNWISSSDLKSALDPSQIIDRSKLGETKQPIPLKEVATFISHYGYYY